jgi:ketosteroid isomerase-like protein/dihydrofolate reductase
MRIRTYTFVTLDGYVSTTDGRPIQLLLPGFPGRTAYGLPEFLATCEAVVMGRTTFLPALDAADWPWTQPVFVLTSTPLPPHAPEHVRTARTATDLVSQMEGAGITGDVHLVGGPRTIQAFRDIGALDEIGLVLIPLIQSQRRAALTGRSRTARTHAAVDASIPRRRDRSVVPAQQGADMSTHKAIVQAYIDGFRRTDHNAILACLADDVVWALHGYRVLQGKEQFDAEIENDAAIGSPILNVDRLVEEGDTVVAIGNGSMTLKDAGDVPFVFSEVFTFADDKILRLETFHINLVAPTDAMFTAPGTQ